MTMPTPVASSSLRAGTRDLRASLDAPETVKSFEMELSEAKTNGGRSTRRGESSNETLQDERGRRSTIHRERGDQTEPKIAVKSAINGSSPNRIHGLNEARRFNENGFFVNAPASHHSPSVDGSAQMDVIVSASDTPSSVRHQSVASGRKSSLPEAPALDSYLAPADCASAPHSEAREPNFALPESTGAGVAPKSRGSLQRPSISPAPVAEEDSGRAPYGRDPRPVIKTRSDLQIIVQGELAPNAIIGRIAGLEPEEEARLHRAVDALLLEHGHVPVSVTLNGVARSARGGRTGD